MTRGGAGADGGGLPLPPELAGGVTLPTTDDTQWQLAVVLRLPILDGTKRFHDYDQSIAELERTRAERAAVAEKIELRARSAVQALIGSFPNIAFSREAGSAAEENLVMVTEGYSRGAMSVITLLDAQNAAVSARLSAASAVYAFLADLMDVYRAMGRASHLMTADERASWFERLEAAAAAAPGDLETLSP